MYHNRIIYLHKPKFKSKILRIKCCTTPQIVTQSHFIYQRLNFNQKQYYCELSAIRPSFFQFTTSSQKFSVNFSLPLPPIYQCRNFNQKLYYCELSVKRLQIVSQPYYIQISLNFNEKCYYCDLSATRLQSHYIYQTANFQSKWYYCELSAKRPVLSHSRIISS